MQTNRRLELLLAVVDHAFDKGSWHGANLTGALRGVRAKQAARKIPGRKCIWEQALHAAYWKHIVLNKLTGAQPFPRRGSNWPKVPEKPTESAWRADLRLLKDIHQRFRRAVIASRGELDETLERMVYGVAFHDI